MKNGLIARSWVEISGPALRHNLRVIRRAIPRGADVIAVVKANAYGHGMVPIAAECLHAGVERLAVATTTEAVTLRRHGFKCSILVLGTLLREETVEAVRHGLVVTLSSREEARQLNSEARRQHKKARAHFKIDTGLGRLGCWHEEAVAEISTVLSLDHVELEGLYTHFASPGEDEAMTQRQWRYFQKFEKAFPNLFSHAAKSDTIVPPRGFAADGIRPGLALYGLAGTQRGQAMLKPLLTWKSRVILTRRCAAGRKVGYGGIYKLPHAETHAIVAVGYADGYRRLLTGRASVLVGGHRCPVRGRVSMDMLIVDVSRAPRVAVGDEVVLLGRQGKQEITAGEIAAWAETISYEIFTGIGNRVVRTYSGFKSTLRF